MTYLQVSLNAGTGLPLALRLSEGLGISACEFG